MVRDQRSFGRFRECGFPAARTTMTKEKAKKTKIPDKMILINCWHLSTWKTLVCSGLQVVNKYSTKQHYCKSYYGKHWKLTATKKVTERLIQNNNKYFDRLSRCKAPKSFRSSKENNLPKNGVLEDQRLSFGVKNK